MRIKFLTIYSTVFLALSLSVGVKASQTKDSTLTYSPSNTLSGWSSWFGDDTSSVSFVDEASNDNNAITVLGYPKHRSFSAAYLTAGLQNESSRVAASSKLSYGSEGEVFLSPVSSVPKDTNNSYGNYAVLNINQNIEVGPEPETYSMMFAGLILMAFVAHRRTSYFKLTDTVFSESAKSSL
ncbi:MAG: hypothetical protein PSV17_00770 [Methylotenera sp.]|uniref:hypothetical protein n=1 Tax=Methylotenera sp. TaxID=2051956 RepID=UPI0024888CD1|nr:hypothetical protein [Methylotenera sp.]MDI1307949.1 hypothetical protein [Methylotenera sp.]